MWEEGAASGDRRLGKATIHPVEMNVYGHIQISRLKTAKCVPRMLTAGMYQVRRARCDAARGYFQRGPGECRCERVHLGNPINTRALGARTQPTRPSHACAGATYVAHALSILPIRSVMTTHRESPPTRRPPPVFLVRNVLHLSANTHRRALAATSRRCQQVGRVNARRTHL